MQNKNIGIYIAILIAGLLIGAAVGTRHYGVGPLAGLKGQDSYARMQGACGRPGVDQTRFCCESAGGQWVQVPTWTGGTTYICQLPVAR